MKYIFNGILLAQASLIGWGKYQHNELQPYEAPHSTTTFPYNDDQGWFVDPQYLLWMPFMENIQYGTKTSNNLAFSSTSFFQNDIKAKVKRPDFGWDSGVRVGIGRYLPHHDLWDINFYTTYFYGEAEEKNRPNLEHHEAISPDFLPASRWFPVSKANAHWHLNYFTLDLSLGRIFTITNTINFHPYFAIRATLQYQKTKNRFALIETITQEDVTPSFVIIDQDGKYSGSNDYWGIGPRIGSHFSYLFAPQWSFLGHLSASIVMGKQTLQQKANFYQVLYTDVLDPEITDDRYKTSDSLNAIRTNLEGYLGIGWETWLNNHTVRIAPSLLFEGSIWFAMNQLWNIWPYSGTGITGAMFDNRATRKHGNLGLMGLTFNLQVDF